MSVSAVAGGVDTVTTALGEIPGLGDVLADIPVVGGLFGGGPEDMDSQEVHGKLYAGDWSALDDEMEPRSTAGASSDVSGLVNRMSQAPEIRQAVNAFASDLIGQLRSQGLIQSDTRDPRGDQESARVVVWASRGGVGSSWDQGPLAVQAAEDVLDLDPQQFQPEPSTSTQQTGGGDSSGNQALLWGGLAAAAVFVATR